MTGTANRWGTWPVRAAWAALPVSVGPALGDALADASRAVQLVAAAMAWLAWAGVLVAVLVPRTTSLTALRIAAPVASATGLWSAVAGEQDLLALLAAGWSALLLLAAFSPATGAAFVDGSSYGDERRLPLRVPGPVLLGPLQLAWALTVGPVVAAPLLLATRQWLVGVLVAVIGAPLVVSGVRSLHNLARRWVVFVPAGLVLHDPMALSEPVLVSRSTIAGVAPAPADSTALDLTRGSLGLALELRAAEPQKVGVLRPGRPPASEVVETDRVLFTPTRPGAVLAEARRRNIAVG